MGNPKMYTVNPSKTCSDGLLVESSTLGIDIDTVNAVK